MKKYIFGALASLVVIGLMAPTGGFPSRPTFQSASIINTITGGNNDLVVKNTANVNGANIQLTDGSGTPNKFLRADAGVFMLLNSNYNASLFSVTDTAQAVLGVATGGAQTAGSLNATALFANGVAVKPVLGAELASVFTVTSSTTLTPITGLALTLPATTDYMVTLILYVAGNASGAGGVKFSSQNGGTSTANATKPGTCFTDIVATAAANYLNGTTALSFATITATVQQDVYICTYFLGGGTAGTYIPEVAQNSSSANALQVLAGSSISAEQVKP
jgi:hypothetical protein